MIEPIPSATIVPLRQKKSQLEVLLLQRNPQLDIHGGAWVFPGGGVEPEDRQNGTDALDAARRAAIRELREEAGITLSTDNPVAFQHWTTPEGIAKRYHAWFFVSEVADDPVQVDNSEIVDFTWVSPRTALERQRSGELTLPPPTFVTLTRLSVFNDPAHCLNTLRNAPVTAFFPNPSLPVF